MNLNKNLSNRTIKILNEHERFHVFLIVKLNNSDTKLVFRLIKPFDYIPTNIDTGQIANIVKSEVDIDDLFDFGHYGWSTGLPQDQISRAFKTDIYNRLASNDIQNLTLDTLYPIKKFRKATINIDDFKQSFNIIDCVTVFDSIAKALYAKQPQYQDGLIIEHITQSSMLNDTKLIQKIICANNILSDQDQLVDNSYEDTVSKLTYISNQYNEYIRAIFNFKLRINELDNMSDYSMNDCVIDVKVPNTELSTTPKIQKSIEKDKSKDMDLSILRTLLKDYTMTFSYVCDNNNLKGTSPEIYVVSVNQTADWINELDKALLNSDRRKNALQLIYLLQHTNDDLQIRALLATIIFDVLNSRNFTSSTFLTTNNDVWLVKQLSSMFDIKIHPLSKDIIERKDIIIAKH